MKKVLKSLLKTAACLMDQYSEQVDRASNRVSDYVGRGKNLVDRGSEIIHGRRDYGLGRVLSFAAGLGIGVGAGILFAPASGKEIRNSIKEKVQDIRSQAGVPPSEAEISVAEDDSR